MEDEKAAAEEFDAIEMAEVEKEGSGDVNAEKSINTSIVFLRPPQPFGESTHSTGGLHDIQVKEVKEIKGHGYTYTWEGLSASCRTAGPQKSKLPWKRKTVTKHLLHNVIGIARPGEVLALMGSSGAGKTTLLNCLTNRNLKKIKVTGIKLINGQPVDPAKIRQMSAYVQQEDLFMSTLTVKEHLHFNAVLRLPRSVTTQERRQKVDQMLKDYGLSKCAHTRIGNTETKGISGGEKKRLSFASEFLTNPHLLFADEPTSGLDSVMAANVVQTLKQLASKGKTIICTIHQPSSDVTALFDKILLLSEGRVAFMGDPRDSIIFFEKLGYRCPKNFNPADFYMKILSISQDSEGASKRKVSEICDDFEKSVYHTEIKAAIPLTNDTTKSVKSVHKHMLDMFKPGHYHSSWLTQYRMLTWRSSLAVFRDPMVLLGRSVQTISLALILGIMYFGQKLDGKGSMNIKGSIFLLVVSITLVNMFSILNVFCGELPIFLRDHSNRMYMTSSYFFGRLTAELPLQILLPLIFSVITYQMIGLNSDLDRFGIACAILLLISNAASAFACVISCLSYSINFAMSITTFPLMLLMVFSGFFMNSGSEPAYLSWIKYLSWYYYGHEALSINQWDDLDIDCSNSSLLCANNGDQILDYLNFEKENLWFDVIMLGVLSGGYTLLALIALSLRAHFRRI